MRLQSSLALLALMIGSYASAASLSLPATLYHVSSNQNAGNSQTLSATNRIVGNISSGRNDRLALEFDLTSVPDNAVITSATISFNITGGDTSASAVNLDDGTSDINLYEYAVNPDQVNGWNYLFQSFGPDQTGGNSGDDTAWAAPGGDFTGDGILTSIADTTFDPTTANTPDSLAFGSTANLISSVTGNLLDDQVIYQMAIDGLTGTSTRSFIRVGSTSNATIPDVTPDFTLNLEFTAIPEPSVLSLGLIAAFSFVATRRK